MTEPFGARFELLRDSGQVSQPAVDSTVEVIEAIECWDGRPLTEDNAAMFVTHMVMAFERLMRGEELNEVPEEVLEEIRQYPETRAFVGETVGKVLAPRGIHVPDAEVAYLALHLAAIQRSHEEGG